MNLLVLAASTALCLLGLEGGLRLLRRLEAGPSDRAHPVSSYTFSRFAHHRLVPEASFRHQSAEFDYVWANNSLGMRDREHPRRKPAGSFRILFLGDSFVQGFGVSLEDTMPVLLEESLNRPPRSKRVEVLNGGVFGYSPFLEYLYLRDLIGSLEPDLVIVGFFLGNDVGEDEFYSKRARLDPQGDSVVFEHFDWPWSAITQALEAEEAAGASRPGGASASPRLRKAIRQLLERSELFKSLEKRLDPRPRGRYTVQREKEFALVARKRGDIRYDLGLVNYATGDRETRRRYWTVSLHYLEKMAALCGEHGAPMILLVIPPMERLIGQTILDEPYEVLSAFGQGHSMPVINLLPFFLTEVPDALYYKYDRHWTTRGQRRAARVLDQEIRRLGLLPQEAR